MPLGCGLVVGPGWQLVFLDGLGLTGQRRLIDLGMAGDHHTIGRHGVAGLKQDMIANHQVIDRDLGQMAVAKHLDLDQRGLLQQTLKGLFVAVLRPGGHNGGDDHREGDAHTLVPLGITEEGQKHCDRERHDQDDDDRVPEVVEQLVPEGLDLLGGNGIGSMLGA